MYTDCCCRYRIVVTVVVSAYFSLWLVISNLVQNFYIIIAWYIQRYEYRVLQKTQMNLVVCTFCVSLDWAILGSIESMLLLSGFFHGHKAQYFYSFKALYDSQMFCFTTQCNQYKTFEKPCTRRCTRCWMTRNTGL